MLCRVVGVAEYIDIIPPSDTMTDHPQVSDPILISVLVHIPPYQDNAKLVMQ